MKHPGKTVAVRYQFLIKRLLIFFGLAVLAFPALIYFPNKGTTDMDIWLEWTTHINRWGPLNAFNIINTNHDYQSTDYPPLTFVNLWLALKVASIVKVGWMIAIKIILLVYYLVTLVALIYLSTSNRKRSVAKSAVISTGLFLGGLLFVVNSQAFSFLDITFAPYLIFSLATFSRRKYFISGICLALAFLTKWISILILPTLIFYFLKNQRRYYKADYLPFVKFFGGIGLVLGLLIVSFWLNHTSILSLVEALRKTFARPYLSALSLNFNWIITYLTLLLFPKMYGGLNGGSPKIIMDYNHPFRLISPIILLLVGIVILKTFLKKKKNMDTLLQSSLMISWSYYIWSFGVHDNHLFITVLIALSLAVITTNWNNIKQYLLLSAVNLSSFLVFYGFPVRGRTIPFPHNFRIIWGIDLTILLAILHVSIYLVYFKNYLRCSSAKK